MNYKEKIEKQIESLECLYSELDELRVTITEAIWNLQSKDFDYIVPGNGFKNLINQALNGKNVNSLRHIIDLIKKQELEGQYSELKVSGA